MSAIDLDGFRSTPLCHDPYDYLIVPGFLKAAAVGAIEAITKGGLEVAPLQAYFEPSF